MGVLYPMWLLEHMKNKINPKHVEGSGGDSSDYCYSRDVSDFREKGRQALTRPSYDRTHYPVSGSLVGVWVAFWVRESNSVRRPNPSNVVLSEPPPQGWANLSGIVRVADVGILDPL